MFLSHPIFGTHNHQSVEHQVIPVTNVAPLLKSPNSESPEGIIIVEVIEGFIPPGIYVEDPLARTTIEGTSKNLRSCHQCVQITPKMAHKPRSLKDMSPPANGSKLLCDVACPNAKSVA